MPKEQRANDRDDDKLGDEFSGQVFDRCVDQLRTIIGRDNLDPFGKTSLEHVELLFDSRDGCPRILALSKHDNTSRDLAFAIELGDPSPHFGAKLDRGDIGQGDGDTVTDRLQRNLSEVVERREIA